MAFEVALARLDGLAQSGLSLLPGLLFGLLILGLFFVLARGVRAGVGRAVRLRSGPPGLALVLGRIGGGLTILLGVLVGAAVAFPSINAADLFGVLGIGGVAIGFAFRDILQNLLAGILLLLTQPFRLGDQIKAGDFEGTVEDIQIRATVIRTYDNRRAVIPNADLFSDKVLVNTSYERRRIAVRLGIGYGDDIARAKAAVLRAMDGIDGVLTEPKPAARVVALGDFAVQLDLFVWINPPRRDEALEVTDRVLERAKAALVEAGIDLPFPTQQVLLHDQTEESDGDRTRQREGWPVVPGQPPPAPRRPGTQRHRGQDSSDDDDADGGRQPGRDRSEGTAARSGLAAR
ncbi:MAG: mechanosensitive ion channel family protein [Acetobacteraceae bacterium]